MNTNRSRAGRKRIDGESGGRGGPVTIYMTPCDRARAAMISRNGTITDGVRRALRIVIEEMAAGQADPARD
jgi:hypothetical protein